MKLSTRILIWTLIALSISLILIATEMSYADTIPSLHAIIEDDNIVLLNDTQNRVRHGEDLSYRADAYVWYVPQRVGLPIPGLVELFEKRSVLYEAVPRASGDTRPLTQDDQDRVIAAAIRYASFDRDLWDITPGASPQVSFSFHRTLLTFLRLFVIASCSTMIVIVLDKLFGLSRKQTFHDA